MLFINYQNSNTKKMIFDASFLFLLILLIYLQLLYKIITLTQKKYVFDVIYELLQL